MATIRYPGPGLMALAAGLPAFTQNFTAAQSEAERQERERARLSLEQRRLGIEQAREARAATAEAERRAAVAAIPQNLGLLAGAVRGTPAVPGQLTATLQPGEDPEAAAFLPRTMGTPAVPGPATTAELFQKPDVAKAYGGLLQAGVQPLGTIIKTPEVARQEQRAEENKQQGQDLLARSADLLKSDKPEERREGVVLAYKGAALLGHLQNPVAITEYFQSEQDKQLNDADLEKAGPLLSKALSGSVMTPEDQAQLAEVLHDAKGPFLRSMKEQILKSQMTGPYGTGPGAAAIRQYHALRVKNPSLSSAEAWQQIERDPNLAADAQAAITAKKAPPDVLRALAVAQKKAEAQAAEEGKRLADLKYPKPEKPTAGDKKTQDRDAALAALTSYAQGQGPELSQVEYQALAKRAGVTQAKLLDYLVARAARHKAMGTPATAPGAPPVAAAGAGGPATKSGITRAQVDAAVTKRYPGKTWPMLTDAEKEQVRQTLGGP